MKHETSTEPILPEPKRSSKGRASVTRRRKRNQYHDPVGISPVLRFSELLTIVKGSKSKLRDVMSPVSKNHDPSFPKGFPLYDSPSSPKLYWKHEVIAWLEARSNKYTNNTLERNSK